MAKTKSGAWVADSAVVTGDVDLGDEASVWHNAVVRGDLAPVSVGRRSNIQDGCILHVNFDLPVEIGEGVSVGHGAILHGCKVGDNTLIGMGATVLDGAVIGRGCIIGAAALVTQNKVIPDGHMAFGNPARVIRELTAEEVASIKANADEYVRDAAEQLV